MQSNQSMGDGGGGASLTASCCWEGGEAGFLSVGPLQETNIFHGHIHCTPYAFLLSPIPCLKNVFTKILRPKIVLAVLAS